MVAAVRSKRCSCGRGAVGAQPAGCPVGEVLCRDGEADAGAVRAGGRFLTRRRAAGSCPPVCVARAGAVDRWFLQLAAWRTSPWRRSGPAVGRRRRRSGSLDQAAWLRGVTHDGGEVGVDLGEVAAALPCGAGEGRAMGLYDVAGDVLAVVREAVAFDQSRAPNPAVDGDDVLIPCPCRSSLAAGAFG